MLAIAIVFALLAISVWLAFVDERKALAVAIVLLPWYGIDVDLGLRITPYQVVLAGLLIRFAFDWGGLTFGPASGLFILFSLYTILRSAIQIPFLPEGFVEGGELRGPGPRALAQIAAFVLSITPMLMALRYRSSPRDIERFSRLYIYSCLVLAVFGWIQLGMWFAVGVNPFPIGAFSNAIGETAIEVRDGMVALGGDLVLRMNSFGGEPKDLGRSLSFAVLLLFLGAFVRAVNVRTATLAAGFLTATIIATLSTSSFASLAIGVLFGMASVLLLSEGVRRGIYGAMAVGGSVCVGLVLIAVLVGEATSAGRLDGYSLMDLIQIRTTGRDQVIEDFDDAIVSYLQENPSQMIFGVGMGNIHLYAEDFLDPEVALYASGTAFTGKHGIVRIVSETGVVGLLLFIAWIGALFAACARIASSDQGRAYAIGAAALVCATAGMYLAQAAFVFHMYLVGAFATLVVSRSSRTPARRNSLRFV